MEPDVRIDPLRIRQLREARAWSQEHLAAISGLSVRTIQRLETQGTASPESRLALSAAFGIEPAALGEQAPASATQLPEPAPRRRGRHAAIFLLVCGSLLLFDFTQNTAITWSKWPVLGWGLALSIGLIRRRTEQQR